MTRAVARRSRVKEVVGRPIAFASTGEKLADFELFHPDRMASRILGMGDVLTLIEKAEEVYEKDEAEAAAAKLLEGDFTLDDFLDQMQQLKKMGPLSSVIGMIPGLPKEARNAEIDDDQLERVEAIIRSMTLEERRKPDLVNGSRRLRIANGSGTTTAEVNALLKQFKDVQKMMKRMGGLGIQEGQAPHARRCPTCPRSTSTTPSKGPDPVAVKLRLMRMGKKKQPTYRVVAADGRSPRDGRFIEIVGTYEPRAEPSVVKIDNDEGASPGCSKGAQPTERVEKLLKISGAWDEFQAAKSAK